MVTSKYNNFLLDFLRLRFEQRRTLYSRIGERERETGDTNTIIIYLLLPSGTLSPITKGKNLASVHMCDASRNTCNLY